MLVWRRLCYDKNFIELLDGQEMENVLHTAHSIPFETSKGEMLRAVFRANSHENVETVFCSELVAWVYKAVGLFQQNENSSNWVTKHWSRRYGADTANVLLRPGFSLEAEVEIR